ncbi:MAG: PhoU domain-containing protein [Planctomycetota bacterium]|nr:PhoU domain-containing protein [Planctomycetota bacterium]
MFHWLLGDKQGLARIFQHFGQMLEDGRHIFDAASNALLGGTDPETIRDDLYATDRRINGVEQKIRRELVVHLAVSERTEFSVCLKLMSLVKDAERIGDYAKNIFDLGVAVPGFNADPAREDLIQVKDQVSRLLAKMRNLHESQDEELARAFCEQGESVLRHCDEKVDSLLRSTDNDSHAVTSALMYRYIKRVMAHSMNIVSSIFMSVDKLDYFDESQETR